MQNVVMEFGQKQEMGEEELWESHVNSSYCIWLEVEGDPKVVFGHVQ